MNSGKTNTAVHDPPKKPGFCCARILRRALIATSHDALMFSLLSALLAATVQTSQAQTETVLYSFGSKSRDGVNPYAGLIFDKKGNLYGTTLKGGGGAGDGHGTAFELTSGGVEKILHRFSSKSGKIPAGGLVFNKKGNLYGTAGNGGAYGYGTVFELSSKGLVKFLYSFDPPSGGDGGDPLAVLIFDKVGNAYGTTSYGGTHSQGTVFELTSGGAEKVLYSFGSQPGDGDAPFAGLVFDKKGNLYGTTALGGTYGYGVVFELTSGGKEKVLYSFGSQSGDGHYPYAGLVFDKSGNLYGTTVYGGTIGYGTVFKLTSAGKEKVLYSFGSQSGDGHYPYAGLVLDKNGNLYGTTVYGGANGFGAVFELNSGGVEKVLYSFQGSPDGYYPTAGLVFDKSGNLYGTTELGGAFGDGTVFKLTP